MSVETVLSLVDLIEQFQLLPPDQRHELTHVLAPQYPDPMSLAKELLRRDWLTPYQINQLFQGRGVDLVMDEYVLLERLGEGGMGQVFKARHRTKGTLVAIKRIHRDRIPNRETLRRFRREMKAARYLDHPNIVRAADEGETDGTLFFAMEYLQGTDLAKLVGQRGPLPVIEACGYIRQAAVGLHHAHERGLVHRDIKPANLLLTADGTIKILDFGLARLDGLGDVHHSGTLTRAGRTLGTPDFIAPEQARNSHTADVRADLYSLGCTLYFLLTARVPFPSGNSTEKLLQHQLDTPTPLLELRPDVHQAIAAIVNKLMAKCPEDRYQNPLEVATVLTVGPGPGTLDGDALSYPPPLSLEGFSTTGSALQHTSLSMASPPDLHRGTRAPRRWLMIIGAVAAALGLMALGALGTLLAMKWLF